MPHVLTQRFERILSAYVSAREQGHIEPNHPVAADFEELRLMLQEHAHAAAHDHIHARWSAGRRNWAKVPWVGMFDERETLTAQGGVYVVYLFCEDMSGVIVGLVYGVQRIIEKHGAKQGYAKLKRLTRPIRKSMAWLGRKGFELQATPDLRTQGRLSRAYEQGMIAHKKYNAQHIPDDTQLLGDLDDLLDAYASHVLGTHIPSPQTWLLSHGPPFESRSMVTLRAKDLAPERGQRVYFYEDREGEGHVLGTGRLATVTEQDTRQWALELEEISPWEAPVSLLDAPKHAPFRASDQPTSTHPMKPLGPEHEHFISTAPINRVVHFDADRALGKLIEHLQAQGWHYEPWQVAAYVTALKTKPFVILAGISGTGKTRLPGLVAEATGHVSLRVPVRPDWSDSGDVLGYTDLSGAWRPGPLLRFAHQAAQEVNAHHVFVLDEMNLARVEQYFAEVLSAMEARPGSPKLLSVSDAVDRHGQTWDDVRWSPNLAVVGTVNMDESTHSFSRKVLDRAFTLEFSHVELRQWRKPLVASTHQPSWPSSAWTPRATRLAELGALTDNEERIVEEVVEQLIALNTCLEPVGAHVGYRTRDEVALFVLHAQEVESCFRDTQGRAVGALDIALSMKVLPRLTGSSVVLRQTLERLLHWAMLGRVESGVPSVGQVESWVARVSKSPDAAYPRCATKLARMWQRLIHEGFTSYWD